jgi:hypothetical protein
LTTCMYVISNQGEFQIIGKTYLIIRMRETKIIHHKYYKDLYIPRLIRQQASQEGSKPLCLLKYA